MFLAGWFLVSGLFLLDSLMCEGEFLVDLYKVLLSDVFFVYLVDMSNVFLEVVFFVILMDMSKCLPRGFLPRGFVQFLACGSRLSPS